MAMNGHCHEGRKRHTTKSAVLRRAPCTVTKLNYTRQIQPRPRPWSKAIAKIILLNSISTLATMNLRFMVIVRSQSQSLGDPFATVSVALFMHSQYFIVYYEWLYSAKVSLSLSPNGLQGDHLITNHSIRLARSPAAPDWHQGGETVSHFTQHIVNREFIHFDSSFVITTIKHLKVKQHGISIRFKYRLWNRIYGKIIF